MKFGSKGHNHRSAKKPFHFISSVMERAQQKKQKFWPELQCIASPVSIVIIYLFNSMNLLIRKYKYIKGAL